MVLNYSWEKVIRYTTGYITLMLWHENWNQLIAARVQEPVSRLNRQAEKQF